MINTPSEIVLSLSLHFSVPSTAHLSERISFPPRRPTPHPPHLLNSHSKRNNNTHARYRSLSASDACSLHSLYDEEIQRRRVSFALRTITTVLSQLSLKRMARPAVGDYDDHYRGIRCNITPLVYQKTRPNSCEIIHNGNRRDYLDLNNKITAFPVRLISYDESVSDFVQADAFFHLHTPTQPTQYIDLDLNTVPLYSSSTETETYRWSTVPLSSTSLSLCSFTNCINIPLPSPSPSTFQLLPIDTQSSNSPPHFTSNQILYIQEQGYYVKFLSSPTLSSPLLSSPLSHFFFVKHGDTEKSAPLFAREKENTLRPPSSQPFSGEAIQQDNLLLISPSQLFKGWNGKGSLKVTHTVFEQKKRMTTIMRTKALQYSVRVNQVNWGMYPQWKFELIGLSGREGGTVEWDEEGGAPGEVVEGRSGTEMNEEWEKMMEETKTLDYTERTTRRDMTKREWVFRRIEEGEGMEDEWKKVRRRNFDRNRVIMKSEMDGDGEEESFWDRNGGMMGLVGVLVVVLIIAVIYKRKRKSHKNKLLMSEETTKDPVETSLA